MTLGVQSSALVRMRLRGLWQACGAYCMLRVTLEVRIDRSWAWRVLSVSPSRLPFRFRLLVVGTERPSSDVHLALSLT